MLWVLNTAVNNHYCWFAGSHVKSLFYIQQCLWLYCQTTDEVALEADVATSSTGTPATDAGIAKIGVEIPVRETESPVIGVSPVWPSSMDSSPSVYTLMPADGVVMDTPATCDLVTCADPVVPLAQPIRCGVTSEFGRRAADDPFSSTLMVAIDAESVDMRAGPVDEWAELLVERAESIGALAGASGAPARTNTTFPSVGRSLSWSLAAALVVAAAAVVVVVAVEEGWPGVIPQWSRWASRMNSSSSFSRWKALMSSCSFACSDSSFSVSCAPNTHTCTSTTTGMVLLLSFGDQASKNSATSLDQCQRSTRVKSARFIGDSNRWATLCGIALQSGQVTGTVESSQRLYEFSRAQ